jgi:DNA-3-methyladenine glycosylase II
MNYSQELKRGCDHLRRHDPVMAELIDQFGLPTLAPHTNYYQELVGSIISQQLSVKAAATIQGRFVALFGHFPAPGEILERDIDELRNVGLSGQKTIYIRDLAARILDGSVRFDHLAGRSNDEIIAELTAVKGIGVWTVHMFLLFCMGRLDVLAVGDLGIKNAVTKLYGFNQTCTSADIVAIASKNNWAPYESIACWYAWRSLDNKPSL